MRIHASHIAGISVYISSSLCVLINILTHTPPWSVIVVESAFTLRSVLFKHSFPVNNFYSKLFSAYKNVCILLLSIGIIYSVYSIIFTVIPIICGIWLLIQSLFLIVLRKKTNSGLYYLIVTSLHCITGAAVSIIFFDRIKAGTVIGLTCTLLAPSIVFLFWKRRFIDELNMIISLK